MITEQYNYLIAMPGCCTPLTISELGMFKQTLAVVWDMCVECKAVHILKKAIVSFVSSVCD
jgi:hypothetical protein